MPTTDCATDIAPPDLQADRLRSAAVPRWPQGPSKLRRGFLFGFAATVTIGLALASWYVGIRIVSADEFASSSTNGVPVDRTAASPLTAAVPAPAEDSMAEAYWYMVPPPQLYLQIAGLGLNQEAGLVGSLKAQGLRAQFQKRDGNKTRILIGPFPTHTELEQAKRRLQSTGVLAIETAY
jgi:hypothetical protein